MEGNMRSKRIALLVIALICILFITVSIVIAQEYNLEKRTLKMTEIDNRLARYEGTQFYVRVEYYRVNYEPFDKFSKQSSQTYGGYLFARKVADLTEQETEKPKPILAPYKEPLNHAQSVLKDSLGFIPKLIDTGGSLLSKLPTSLPGFEMLTLVPKLISITNTVIGHLQTVQSEGPKLVKLISKLLNIVART